MEWNALMVQEERRSVGRRPVLCGTAPFLGMRRHISVKSMRITAALRWMCAADWATSGPRCDSQGTGETIDCSKGLK